MTQVRLTPIERTTARWARLSFALVATTALLLVLTASAAARGASLNTKITGGPDGTTDDSTPTFTFTANRRKASFKCSLDGGRYVSCSSPETTRELTDGKHVFAVKAVRRGAADRTPAVRRFVVDTSGSSSGVGEVDPPTFEPDDGTVDDPTTEFTLTPTL